MNQRTKQTAQIRHNKHNAMKLMDYLMITFIWFVLCFIIYYAANN